MLIDADQLAPGTRHQPRPLRQFAEVGEMTCPACGCPYDGHVVDKIMQQHDFKRGVPAVMAWLVCTGVDN